MSNEITPTADAALLPPVLRDALDDTSFQPTSDIPDLIRMAEFTDGERNRIEDLAYLFGNSPESYDICHSQNTILSTPCRQAAFNVYADRRYWHIPGGVVADESRKPAAVNWLRRVAAEQKRTIAVYSVSAEDVPLFEEAGFVINKFGEEPILELADLDWKGGSYEWVRRQTNFCRRNGLEVHEIVSAKERSAIASEMTAIFHEDLRDRVYSKPLHLLEGRFDPHSLGRRRLFVARRSPADRCEGFLIATPMNDGTAWAFECYRKRSHSVRGTIPFLFREVADRLRWEGVRQISLCLIPGKGIGTHDRPGSDPWVRWILSTWYHHLDVLFNAAGQDYFKARFRPRYVDRYLCVYPQNTVLSILSFIKVTGAIRVNPVNLVRKLVRGASSR